ncbi:hypothetical protein [Xanthomonas arboricola]|uniref:hypothetical protein n=1 Tax=Xanthomonas arboricola TaxID=56448 RepID=UPI00161E60C9|nr:hypothetical protein [Xanthomonas arboricola]
MNRTTARTAKLGDEIGQISEVAKSLLAMKVEIRFVPLFCALLSPFDQQNAIIFIKAHFLPGNRELAIEVMIDKVVDLNFVVVRVVNESHQAGFDVD